MSGFPELSIAILAAGASRRMGQAKALMEWQGSSLLEHSIQLAKNLQAARIDVISGAYTEEFKHLNLWNTPVELQHNPNWEEGMASSIRMAVKLAQANTFTKGLLIMAVDQPLIPLEHYRKLAEAFFGAPSLPASSFYAGRLGIPAIFPPSLFPDLLELKGDKGAAKLLNTPPQNAHRISCLEAAWDVDTQEDWDTLNAR